MRPIDADALKEVLDNHLDHVPITGKRYGDMIRRSEIIDCIYLLTVAPTVDAVERKRGRWIEENRRPKSMMFYCSECYRTAYDPQNHHSGRKRCRYAFCPNCGADMRGDANEEM